MRRAAGDMCDLFTKLTIILCISQLQWTHAHRRDVGFRRMAAGVAPPNQQSSLGFTIRRPLRISGTHLNPVPEDGLKPDEAGYPETMRSFVTANSDGLFIDNRPFFMTGSVTHYLMSRAAWFQGRPEVLRVFWDMQDLGMNTVLVYTFQDGPMWNALQPEPGVLDEFILNEGLDYVLEVARESNIRVILALTGFYKGRGGMAQYVEWVNGTSVTEFYENEGIKSMYKDYIYTIVTRNNTRTGVRYFDDPTILGWSIGEGLRDPGHPGSEVFQDWLRDISSYVKSLDPNHLVMAGTMGYFGMSTPKYLHANPAQFAAISERPYTQDAVCDGLDFVMNGKVRDLDVVVATLKTDFWTVCDDACRLEFAKEWVVSHLNASHQLGKPFLLSGIQISKPVSSRNKLLTMIYRELSIGAENGYPVAGSLLWMLAAGDYPDYDGYTLYYKNESAALATQTIKQQLLEPKNITMFNLQNPQELLECFQDRAEKKKTKTGHQLNDKWEDTQDLFIKHANVTLEMSVN